MTKSKKQKQKKKDFLKKKLKVGKPTGKPSNSTDTSFTARTLSVRSQLVNNAGDDLRKRLPLLKHHNDKVRKETLGIYIKAIPKIISTQLMTPLISQTSQLICDDSKDVREQLLELFDEVGKHDEQVLKLHCRSLVLYINMGMTHILPRVQADSTKFLGCLLKYCGQEFCDQAWNKLMAGIFRVLSWETQHSKNSNQAAGAMQTSKRDNKFQAAHLSTLYALLECGCKEPTVETTDEDTTSNIQKFEEVQYMTPSFPQAYGYLKLFDKQLKSSSSNKDNSSVSSSDALDVESRIRNVENVYLPTMKKQIEQIIQEGGEAGKNANNIKKLISEIFS
ncbi:Rix1 complex component involved in 60S ribosome maturation [Nakaseomyces glabratus]|nr:Rix1 complex component involved in 60S ribosome maturation [Nakaseomyces glabratus]